MILRKISYENPPPLHGKHLAEHDFFPVTPSHLADTNSMGREGAIGGFETMGRLCNSIVS